jgi:protein involved in polysaccharide export with SLBB domain
MAGGLTALQPSTEAFYIYGQVIRPGGYPLTKPVNVLEAIILAGGPTPAAKMNEVKVIIKGNSFSNVATLNLEKYSQSGLPVPIEIKPGDTIYIPQRKQSMLTALTRRGIFYDILRIAVTATTSMLIYNLIN